eukprot:TRINITY_DN529_c1_g1_i1.p11 TRINITY_DN529_c1_g1~~TRINITY_DN529_c1_g1_i1.p11  ORF type:complete len:100 (-),score=5.18 TRINITY_DN529_c1_g1_i1:1096-1395(-)
MLAVLVISQMSLPINKPEAAAGIYKGGAKIYRTHKNFSNFFCKNIVPFKIRKNIFFKKTLIFSDFLQNVFFKKMRQFMYKNTKKLFQLTFYKFFGDKSS